MDYLDHIRNHHTTAKALADAGFVVVAPLHAVDPLMKGDDIAKAIHWRTMELKKALEAVLGIDSFRKATDTTHIHALGYSLGATTVLHNAGAGMDLKKKKCSLYR